MQNLNLTEMEKQVLTALISELYAEPGHSDVDATDLSRITKIPTKSIRGVLSSLVKKKIVSLEDTDDNTFIIVYLNEPFYYLHPTWKTQIA
jgi:sugar-specific transcriptional regulator TrmB